MDKYLYNNEIGFYIGVKVNRDDIELTEEQFNKYNGKRVGIVDGELVEIPKTEEELKAKISNAIQSLLDTRARELRYDNMNAVAKYLGFDNYFRAEAESLAKWCADCWAKAGELESSGEVYTADEVLALMPEYTGATQ